MVRGLAILMAAWIVVPVSRMAAEVVQGNLLTQALIDGQVTVVVALRPPPGQSDLQALAAQRARVANVRESVLRVMPPDEIRVEREYEVLAGFRATVTPAGLVRLAAHPDVWRIGRDLRGRAALDQTVRQIRADRVHARGVGGAGTVIAVLDTGVDASHPDLAEALDHEECFCIDKCCPGESARRSGPGSAATLDGHGVHVAGIAVSRGRIAPTGVAPQAGLVAVRVLDNDGEGFLSDWLAALDWLHVHRPDVRIVNMSLTSFEVFPEPCDIACRVDDDTCALNVMFGEIIDRLYRRGALVFAAAGNRTQPDELLHTLPSPACVSRAIAVGATGAVDEVAGFSKSGPMVDLLAPGSFVVSSDLGGTGVRSGTSMATPHAAGAAALLMSARPGAAAGRIEDVLQATGVPIVDRRNGLWFPRIDVFAALAAVTEAAELERGGGSRGNDCLLEWNFIPPDIVRRGPRPVAACTDNDSLCDADTQEGQCTFLLSLCFNVRDPLMRGCDVSEPLVSYRLSSPRVDAVAGSLERENAESLTHALPSFPLAGSSTCSIPFPYVVSRAPTGDGPGYDRIRMSVSTAGRRDYDHMVLQCR